MSLSRLTGGAFCGVDYEVDEDACLQGEPIKEMINFLTAKNEALRKKNDDLKKKIILLQAKITAMTRGATNSREIATLLKSAARSI
jgi:hypothetical protein